MSRAFAKRTVRIAPRGALFTCALLVACVPACARDVPAVESDATPSPAGSVAPTTSSDPFNGDADSGRGSGDEVDNGSVARMRLLEPGSPPRRPLRYAWRDKQRETLSMELRTAASTEEGTAKQPEIVLPPVRIVLAIDPRGESPEGNLSYTWRVTSASVAADAQTPSSLAAGMQAEVAAIEHLSGTGVVTPRGLSVRVTIDALPTLGPGATGQMIEQVRQTLRDVAAPFPEEPVGVGARWEKLSQLASRDARVTQTETFKLIDVTGASGSLDDQLAQTAPPQPLRSPGDPNGGPPARIESMLASGDSQTRFDLSRLVPQTKFEGTTTMVVSSGPPVPSPDSQRRRMTMVMRVGIVLDGSLQ